MPVEKWPKSGNGGGMTPYTNPNQPRIEPARPGVGNRALQEVGRWGAEQAKEQAKGFAIGKAAQFAAKTAIGARMFSFTRWFWIAEWGSLAVSVLFAILGVVGIIQKDFVLGTLVLVLAGMAFGVHLLVKMLRRFVERQIARGFTKFQSLIKKGAVRPDEWPEWYRQNRKRI
jgi:hypothetical protein